MPGRPSAGAAANDNGTMIETLRHPVEDDYPRVTAVMAEWWAGMGGEAGHQFRVMLLPRLFFQHFTDTSYVLDLPGGGLGAFLVGFVSQSAPRIGYVHFVGVAPDLRRTGLGAGLYRRFFADVTARGCREVHAITGTGNLRSVAFHTGL